MLTDPPAFDDLEVSIFGPGKGECILVHLGYDDWIVVDSCVDQADGRIPALDYLDRIGVDPSRGVRMVLATHAHDDHIAGISRIFDVCESAFFVCSSALTREEFASLVKLDEQHLSVRQKVYKEYRKVFQTVRERGGRTRGLKHLKRALEGRLLDVTASGDRPPVTLRCLSPSDDAVTRALESIAAGLPTADRSRRSSSINPNELAIALWIECGGTAVLLGADLLNGPSGCGWEAVLATFKTTLPASLFKVPHHGSPNAHHPRVWDELTKRPNALLAPYRAGARPRPAPEDIARLTTVSERVYLTASPDLPAQSRRIQREAAALGPLAKNVREPWGKSGHVRARVKIGCEDWNVQLVPPARQA